MKLRYYLRGVGVGMLLCFLVYSAIIIPQKYTMSDDEIRERAKSLGMTEETEVDLSALTGTPAPSKGAEQTEASITPMPTQPSAPTAPVSPTMQPTPTTAKEDEKTTTTPEAPTSEAENAMTPAATPEVPATPTAIPTPTTMPTPTLEATPSPLPTPTIAPTPTETPKTPTPTKAPEPTKAVEDSNTNQIVTLSIVKGMGSESVAARAANIGLVEDATEFNRYLVQNGYEDLIMIGDFRIKKGASYREIAEMITENR